VSISAQVVSPAFLGQQHISAEGPRGDLFASFVIRAAKEVDQQQLVRPGALRDSACFSRGQVAGGVWRLVTRDESRPQMKRSASFDSSSNAAHGPVSAEYINTQPPDSMRMPKVGM
jgi:hypothetical protein